MFVFILLGYIFLAGYQLIPLYKQKVWRDFWVASVLEFLGLVIASMISFGVDIPSPEEPIRMIINSMFGK